MPDVNPQTKKRLQDFQLERLKGTFQDFLKDPAFEPMCTFFMEHLYSSEDYTARNESFKKLVHSFEKLFGKEILHSVSMLVELHDLSDKLDDSVVVKLDEMKRGKDFDMAAYEKAYLLADNYDQRVYQIDLLVEAVHTVHRIAHYPFIGFLLKTLMAGARVIGATPMVQFLQNGWTALKSTKDVTPFTQAIRDRELARLNRIYGVKA